MIKSNSKIIEVFSNEASSMTFNLLPDLVRQVGQVNEQSLDIAAWVIASGGSSIVLLSPPIAAFKCAGLEIRTVGAVESESVAIFPTNSGAPNTTLTLSPATTATIDNDGNFITVSIFTSKYLLISITGLTVGRIVELSLVVKK